MERFRIRQKQLCLRLLLNPLFDSLSTVSPISSVAGDFSQPSLPLMQTGKLMKKTMLLLLTLTSLSTYAQTISFGSFKIVEQEVLFQKVFSQDSITVSALEKYYKTLPYVSHLEASAEGVQFEVSDITVDYKKFQISQVGTPLIMQTGKFSGKVAIGVKDGKYRVTMKSIQMTGDMGYKKITEKDNLTNYASRNSATILAPDWCRPNMLGLLDQSFADKLQFKKGDEGDW